MYAMGGGRGVSRQALPLRTGREAGRDRVRLGSPPLHTGPGLTRRLPLPVRPRVGADHLRHSASADGLGSDFPDIHAPTPFRGVVPTLYRMRAEAPR
jgi:hypothetical protein